MPEATNKPISIHARRVMEFFGARPFMLEMQALAEDYRDRRTYAVVEGVAVIDIVGVLGNDWWFADTTYRQIQDEVQMARLDPDVRAILLCVDSPGGETTNAFETRAIIAAAGKDKPVWCAASNAYSAGYLLASAADQIYVSETTSGVGSIGVYSMHADYSDALKGAGIKITFISAGTGKTDGNPYEPLSEAAREKIKSEVDRLYGEFVSCVSGDRKLSDEQLRKMGAALIHGAPQAIASGLADKAGSFDTAWADLALKVQANSTSLGIPASAGMTQKGGTPTMETPDPKPAADAQPTAAEIQKQVAEAREAGFAAASEIASLCLIAGKPAMISGFLGAKKDPAAVRAELVALQVKAASEHGEIVTATMPGAGTKQNELPPDKVAASWATIVGQLDPATKGGK